MNNYRVAIPSLNRVKELGEKTLKTLDKHDLSYLLFRDQMM